MADEYLSFGVSTYGDKDAFSAKGNYGRYTLDGNGNKVWTVPVAPFEVKNGSVAAKDAALATAINAALRDYLE